jgi:group I intron endonuclease
MKSNISGIYCITSKLNNKKYVGQSININNRWQQHLSELKANKHCNNHLQNHFNKYLIDDLTFEILEEIVDLSLLTEREQFYLDLLKPEFNMCPAAGSSLGYKKEGAKNYCYIYNKNGYVTFYTVLGKILYFSFHYTEEEAIKEIEYIKTLTDTELLKYKQECLNKPPKRPRGAKYYYWKSSHNKWQVTFRINGKIKHFGHYAIEQEAIDKVKQVKLQLGIDTKKLDL